MEFNRRVRDRMSFILLIVGSVASVALSGIHNETGVNLDCTNDFTDSMFCHFEAQNCTEYSLTLENLRQGFGKVDCISRLCDSGQCCCSLKMTFVLGESHKATVWKRGQSVESKIISVTRSIKPNTPKIITVKESNGIFVVKWRSNWNKDLFIDTLSAEITYHKKGYPKEESTLNIPYTVDEQNNFEMPGQLLEPRTTYVFRVKISTSLSGLFSDSEEYEFTVPASRRALLLAVIISLSIVAVIISGSMFHCYVKFKTKWWDSVAECQNSKILLMKPSEQEVLKPVPPIVSIMHVEPFIPDDSKPWSKWSLMGSSIGSLQQSSGISTGSSSLSYANAEPADIIAGVQDALSKAFANISPISPVTTNLLTESNQGNGLLCTPYNTCGVRADNLSSGSSGFDNKTYSILLPNCPCQTVTDSFENQTQAEMLCDSAYHSSEANMMTCFNKQAPAYPDPVQQDIILPPVALSHMPTDMSYQCNVDSGRFSYAENSSLSSISSSTNTTASCDLTFRVENVVEVLSGATNPDGKSEEVTKCDENPCYSCMPASSHSCPPVVDDYQAFQTLVKQPDILFSEQRSGEEDEHLERYPEKSSTKIPQNVSSSMFPHFTNDVQGGRCLSEIQRPFLSLMSADRSMPVITDSGYQSV